MTTNVKIKMVRGFEHLFERDRGIQAHLHRTAEKAAQIAKGLAPVDTGAYRDSITVQQGTKGPELVATDFKAHWIEWGTVRTRAFAPLRTAARQVASRVIED